MGRIPTSDTLVGITVAVVTVLTDLAIAVVVGVLMSTLVFAWKHAKNMHFEIEEKDGVKIYKPTGPLFFASIHNFRDQFDPYNDPQEVIVDFARSRVSDHSGIEAIDALAERYMKQGKKLHLRHLSPECIELLHKARELIEVNVIEDPKYSIADDKLG